MKEYKRLTEKENYDGYVEENCGNCHYYDKNKCSNKDCYEVIKRRLCELEDKIERGELVENKVVTYMNMARSGSKTLIDKAVKYDELKTKIENGTLIELPCKVGDKVWVLDRNNKLIKMEITEYSLSEALKRYYAVCVMEGYGYWLYESELNEDWFLTKSEAEAKLKELKGEV